MDLPAPHSHSTSPPSTPHAVARVVELDLVARCVVEEFGAAPCAVVACAFRAGDGWEIAEGAFGVIEPQGAQVTPLSPFDLASLTKPFSALTLARIVRQGLLEWTTPLGTLVQEAVGTPSSPIALELLLAHRSGLDGHRPLYAPLERGMCIDRYTSLQEAALARRPECVGSPPVEGFAPTYSDLGYLLLGEAMARATARPLDKLVHAEVCQPLGCAVGSARQWRELDPQFDTSVVPTEVVSWRSGAVRGVVHDENAWALSGAGMCAHAGLFGRARDVAQLGAGVLDALEGRRSEWLAPEDLRPIVRMRPEGTLRAGFDGKSESGSSAGSVCSAETFGHLGFTGTSVWIDPRTSAVAVLLTNRVHPTRAHEAIKRARPATHDALFRFASGRTA